jgi:hypothetical protein
VSRFNRFAFLHQVKQFLSSVSASANLSNPVRTFRILANLHLHVPVFIAAIDLNSFDFESQKAFERLFRGFRESQEYYLGIQLSATFGGMRVGSALEM